MDANRWRRIEEVCDAALKLPSVERPACLDRECGSDADLRREVDSLLAHEATAERFLNTPAAALSPATPSVDLVGKRFGEYEIAGKLGEGGMGEVYRARDLTLGRHVAIKILPAAFMGDRDRLRRFVREARLLATVNHPSIGAIYGLIEINGAPALVLELVDGETLSTALGRGPMPATRALTIAAQIADALDHAHRRGITHRDLKPANIMLTRSGVKLLDFGVGKWTPRGPDATVTPPSTLTGKGVIVGTLHYMSPEQLEGRASDARSDIFSFGAVLFEMLSGRKAFDGPSQASIIAAVMQTPAPRLDGITGAPPNVDRIVAKCLDKDPDQRWQSAGDLREAINWLLADQPSPMAARVRGSRAATRSAVGAAALIAVGLIGWSAANSGPPNNVADASPPVRFTLEPIEGRIRLGLFDINDDGTQLVYSVVPAPGVVPVLQHRYLDRFDAVTIPGTERAGLVALSPDAEWIAFIANRTLKKTRIGADATPITLLENVRAFQISWPVDDTILLVGRNEPVRRVSANGGEVGAITTIQKETEVDHHGPELLPSGDVLFTVHTIRNHFSIAAQRANSTEHKTIIESGFGPRLLSSGHLVFGRGSSLFAVAFDSNALEVRGEPVMVMERVSTDRASGISDARVSRSGTLVYQRELPTNERLLMWVDRSGKETPLPLAARTFEHPSVSPDGKQIAFVTDEHGRQDIYTFDLDTRRQVRLTQGGANWGPVWTADGSGIAFGRDAGAASELMLYRQHGGSSETLASSVNNLWPAAFSLDGRTLIVTQQLPTGALFMSSLVNKAFTQMRPAGTGTHGFARLSPDGRWLAYTENIGSGFEIYVQGFPEAGTRRQITVNGGTEPIWRRDGKELYFKNAGKIFAIPIDTSVGLKWGTARPLFTDQFQSLLPSYDVAADGRFLMIKPGPSENVELPLSVVVNWQTELASRVPIRR